MWGMTKNHMYSQKKDLMLYYDYYNIVFHTLMGKATHNIVAAHGYFGRLIFQYTSMHDFAGEHGGKAPHIEKFLSNWNPCHVIVCVSLIFKSTNYGRVFIHRNPPTKNNKIPIILLLFNICTNQASSY